MSERYQLFFLFLFTIILVYIHINILNSFFLLLFGKQSSTLQPKPNKDLTEKVALLFTIGHSLSLAWRWERGIQGQPANFPRVAWSAAPGGDTDANSTSVQNPQMLLLLLPMPIPKFRVTIDLYRYQIRSQCRQQQRQNERQVEQQDQFLHRNRHHRWAIGWETLMASSVYSFKYWGPRRGWVLNSRHLPGNLQVVLDSNSVKHWQKSFWVDPERWGFCFKCPTMLIDHLY